MKRSFLLLLVLALLLLAGALAPLFKSDPGHVLINFGDWTIETSVLVLVTAFLILWFVVQIVVWIWRMPVETARRMREQRAFKQLEKGLLALTEGDWNAAEKALEKSASVQARTTAHYLAAAQAADSQDADERREYYLEQADSGFPWWGWVLIGLGVVGIVALIWWLVAGSCGPAQPQELAKIAFQALKSSNSPRFDCFSYFFSKTPIKLYKTIKSRE